MREAPATGEEEAIAAAGKTGDMATREGAATTGEATKIGEAASTDGAAVTGDLIGTWQKTSASREF
jgi:3-keto-L-gulonate-6-phosphate decarboxylase